MKKPAPSAAPATIGSLPRSLALTFVASPISSRRLSTACASCSRSASISRRSCSGVGALAAIALQCRRGQLRFANRLLGNRRRAALDPADTEGPENSGRHEQEERDHEQSQ